MRVSELDATRMFGSIQKVQKTEGHVGGGTGFVAGLELVFAEYVQKLVESVIVIQA